METNTKHYAPCTDTKVTSLMAATIAKLVGISVDDVEFVFVFAGRNFPLIQNVILDSYIATGQSDAFITCMINHEKRTFRLMTNPDVSLMPNVLHKINYIDGAINSGGVFITAQYDEAVIFSKHQDLSMYIMKERKFNDRKSNVR